MVGPSAIGNSPAHTAIGGLVLLLRLELLVQILESCVPIQRGVAGGGRGVGGGVGGGGGGGRGVGGEWSEGVTGEWEVGAWGGWPAGVGGGPRGIIDEDISIFKVRK